MQNGIAHSVMASSHTHTHTHTIYIHTHFTGVYKVTSFRAVVSLRIHYYQPIVSSRGRQETATFKSGERGGRAISTRCDGTALVSSHVTVVIGMCHLPSCDINAPDTSIRTSSVTGHRLTRYVITLSPPIRQDPC